MKEEKERVLKWIEDNPFMTVGELMESYAQHVTAEKDKEIEAERQTLKALVKKGNDRWNALQAELQQLKEENERLRKCVIPASELIELIKMSEFSYRYSVKAGAHSEFLSDDRQAIAAAKKALSELTPNPQ